MPSLATVQDLAQRTGVQFDPTDVQAIRALADASALVRAYLGLTLDEVSDDTVILSGTGTSILYLPEVPVIDVTDVTLIADDETEALLETTDWRLVARHGKLVRLGKVLWPFGYSNISVTYSHGYTTIPDAIKAATCQIAARMKGSTGSSGQVRSETIGSYSVTFEDFTGQQATGGLAEEEEALLYPFHQLTVV